MDFVDAACLAASYRYCLSILSLLETNRAFVNQNPKTEPQLGRRGLYRGYPETSSEELALLWVLNLSDGEHSLLDIAERSDIPFAEIKAAADVLLSACLLKELPK